MGEGGGRSRVRKVIGRHINGLHGGDGAVLGGGDAFLHLTHFRGQGGLITHGRRHAAQQGAYLGAGLGETEDVVDEKEDIPGAGTRIAVSEAFGQSKAAQGHAGTGTRGFVHLAEDHGYLTLFQFFAIHQGQVPFAFFHGLVEGFAVTDYVGFDHFPQEVVALTGALAHAGEHGKAVVRFGDVVDKFLDENGLAHAGATEQADLTALQIGLQEVDDLDAREEDVLRGGEFLELGRIAVDGQGALAVQFGHAVDSIPRHVHHAAADLCPHGHGDGTEGVFHLQTAAETIRGIHGNAAYGIFADVLLHLQDEGFPIRPLHGQSVVYSGEFCLGATGRYVEMHIHNRSYDLRDVPDSMGHRFSIINNPYKYTEFLPRILHLYY